MFDLLLKPAIFNLVAISCCNVKDINELLHLGGDSCPMNIQTKIRQGLSQLVQGDTVHFTPISLYTARRALELSQRFALSRPFKAC